MTTILTIKYSKPDPRFDKLIGGDNEIQVAENIDEAISLTRKKYFDVVCIPLPYIEDNTSYLKITRWFSETRGSEKSPTFFLISHNFDDLHIIDAGYGLFTIKNNKPSQEFLSIIRQATGRKRMERALRMECDHNAKIIRNLPFVCIEVKGGNVNWTNQAVVNITGFSPGTIIGRKFNDIITLPEKLNPSSENTPLIGSYRHSSGDHIPCRLFYFSEGQLPDGLWFLDDRYEYSLLEKKLHAAKQECSEQLYLSESLILRIIPDGTISSASRSALKLFGYEEGGLAGQPISILFPEDISDRNHLHQPLETFFEIENEASPSAIHVTEHIRSDGKKLFVAWTVKGFYNSSDELTGVLCIGTDMTEDTPEGDGRITTGVWRDRILEGTDIDAAVFDAILQTAMEIGREGREGKPVGTSFIVGDLENVMGRSRQLILNPFYGHPEESRLIRSPDVMEMLKEYALLDGAFVISGNGMLEAAGRYITVDTSSIILPKGMGTRHSSIAALTAATSAIGLVVSESGGRVSILKGGKIVRMIG